MGTNVLAKLKLPGFEDPSALPKHYGVVGDFDSPEELLQAIRTARMVGFTKMETYSPFPVHGVDEALGAPRSPLGYIVLCAGLTGLASAILLQWWTGAVNYPLTVAGKPLFAFEPSVPIMFELTVLLGAFGAVLGMFHLNKMPTYYHSFFNFTRAEGASNDRFLLAVEVADPHFDADKLKSLLESCGSRHTELVEA